MQNIYYQRLQRYLFFVKQKLVYKRFFKIYFSTFITSMPIALTLLSSTSHSGQPWLLVCP